MGFILFIVAILLSLVMYPIAMLTSITVAFRKSKFKTGLKRLNLQLMSIAVSIDANGNVVCGDLLNILWRKEGGHKFGSRKETISSVLGKNQLTGTLTFAGWLMAEFLDLIQKDHCLRSIDIKI